MCEFRWALRIYFESYRAPFGTRHKSPPNWRSLIVEDQEGTRPKNLRSISLSCKKSSKMFARQRERVKGEEQSLKKQAGRPRTQGQRVKSEGQSGKGKEAEREGGTRARRSTN